DDPLVEQAAVDVERTLPTGGLLDDHRYEWAHGPRFVSLRSLESFRFTGSAAKTARSPKTSNGFIRAKPGLWVSCEALLGRRDRLGRLGAQIQRLALRQVVFQCIEPAVGAQAFQQLLG